MKYHDILHFFQVLLAVLMKEYLLLEDVDFLLGYYGLQSQKFFPGIELNLTTACIPVINVVLSTKELIAGTLNLNYLLISFLVMGILALISVFISYKQFGKESNILT